MLNDMADLRRVGRVLNEAHTLLESERERLRQRNGPEPSDGIAGSPAQTLQGISGMSDSVQRALEQVALAAGYSALGLDRRAGHALGLARMRPVSLPSGADRMSRPLGKDTVRALELIRDLDFFPQDVGIEIEVALAAPQATYPPADWNAHRQGPLARPEQS